MIFRFHVTKQELAAIEESTDEKRQRCWMVVLMEVLGLLGEGWYDFTVVWMVRFKKMVFSTSYTRHLDHFRSVDSYGMILDTRQMFLLDSWDVFA